MDMIPLTPARRAQLEAYAEQRGQDPATALDEAVAAYLEEERRDYQETVEGIRRGYASMKAGRTKPAAEFFARLQQKHGLPD
jgi:predicted transcriptional regulator